MADSQNISIVRRLYQARGNPEVIRHDFFGHLFTDFDEFVANGSEFFESGEHVIALGNYAGRARRTGKRFTGRFAHVWTLQESTSNGDD